MAEQSLREKIARLGFQFAYMIDDKNIAGAWMLTNQRGKWIDMSEKILSLLRAEIDKAELTRGQIDEAWPNNVLSRVIISKEQIENELVRCGQRVARAQLDAIKKLLEG